MTPSLPLILCCLLSTPPTIYASPIALKVRTPHKRSPSPHTIGTGFAIAISVLTLASLIFYLGVRRGRSGTWFCWHDPPPPLYTSHLPEKIQIFDTTMLKSRISSPLQMCSSALPELSPVEAQPQIAELSPIEAKPKRLELCALDKVVHEMGQASPRRPPSMLSSRTTLTGKSIYSLRTSRKSSFATAYRKSMSSVKTSRTAWKSMHSTTQGHEKVPKVNSWFDRKSWFCRGALEIEDEEKRARGKEGCETVGGAEPLTSISRAVLMGGEGRESSMDWSDMEWLSKVYSGNKST